MKKRTLYIILIVLALVILLTWYYWDIISAAINGPVVEVSTPVPGQVDVEGKPKTVVTKYSLYQTPVGTTIKVRDNSPISVALYKDKKLEPSKAIFAFAGQSIGAFVNIDQNWLHVISNGTSYYVYKSFYIYLT